MNYLRILLAWGLFLGSGAPSFANFAMSPSGTTTAFAIDGSNQGTSLCAAASTECPAAVPINTAGSPLFTSGTPGVVNATLQASATTAIGKVDPNTIATWGLAPVGGTSSSPTNALAAGCQFNSSAPTFTTGNVGVAQCTAAGSWHTTVDNATTAIPNNADGVAVQTGAANSPVNNYNYGFNGTSWDRLQVDGSKFLKVNVSAGAVADPCMFQAKSNFAIATSSGNLQLVAGVSAKKVYICSFHVIAAAAAVINVIEGTGAACTTANEAAVWGSTTAASGESLPANGGMTYGDGQGTIGFTGTAANGICLLQSGTTALAGNVTYVQQ